VRVLVTDVGKYIVRMLAERGHEVRRAIRLSRSSPTTRPSKKPSAAS
jgi:nucleoside-diphosphate-sugar epimerase